MKHAIIIENCNTWNISQGVDAIKNWVSDTASRRTDTPDIMITTTNDNNTIMLTYEDVSTSGKVNDDEDIKAYSLFSYFTQPITQAAHDLDVGKGKISYINSSSTPAEIQTFAGKFQDFMSHSSVPKTACYAVEGLIGKEAFASIVEGVQIDYSVEKPMEVANENKFELHDITNDKKPVENVFNTQTEPTVYNINDVATESVNVDSSDIPEVTLDDIGANGLEEEVPMLTDEDTKYVLATVEEVKEDEATTNEEIVVNIKEIPYEESVAQISKMFDSLLKRFNLSTYVELEDKLAKLFALAEVVTPKTIPDSPGKPIEPIPFEVERTDNTSIEDEETTSTDTAPEEEPEIIHNIIIEENPLEEYGEGETVVEAFVNTNIDWTNEEAILGAIKNLKSDEEAFEFMLEHKLDIPRNIMLGACSINMHKKAISGEIELNDTSVKTARLLKI